MATAERVPFSWHHVESLPNLERLRLVLDTLPDGEIMAALDARRGRGRNDHPVRAMWRALIAGVVFQHAPIQSLLREVGRNPALLELCGFDPLPFKSAPVTELREGNEGPGVVTHPATLHSTVPSRWNFSRFLTCVVRLEKERGLVSAMVESLRASLFEEVPDFGRHLGYDGKAIESHSTGRVAKDKGKTSHPDADWGKHETSGVHSKTGAIWKTVTSWFGLRPSPDRRHPLRAPGGLRGDAGVGPGGQDAGDPVRKSTTDGRSLRRFQRRPRSRQRPAEEAAWDRSYEATREPALRCRSLPTHRETRNVHIERDRSAGRRGA